MLDNYGFDLWAKGYDKSVNISDDNDVYPFAGYKKLMNFVYNTVVVKSPAKVMDVGIGTGTLAFRLYEAGNEITGIDFSNDMLNHSRAKMPNATLIQYDFSKGLPSELNEVKFDFIIITYALHHLADDVKVEFIQTLLEHIDETGTIIIGDIGFRDRGSLEKCKKSCGDKWDEDEVYFVFAELNEKLSGRCMLSYRPFSHCSGILNIKLLR